MDDRRNDSGMNEELEFLESLENEIMRHKFMIHMNNQNDYLMGRIEELQEQIKELKEINKLLKIDNEYLSVMLEHKTKKMKGL